MTKMDTVPRTEIAKRPVSRPPWMAAVVALLVVVSVALGAMWLAERGSVGDLESEVAAAEAAAEEGDAALATQEARISELESRLAAAEAAVVSHPQQAEVQALYDAFLAAIADPDAETVASFFTDFAANTSAAGVRTRGAEEIGRGYERYGPIDVVNADGLIVNGEITLRAAMRGTAFGVDGLLVTTIVPTDDGLKFSEVTWLG